MVKIKEYWTQLFIVLGVIGPGLITANIDNDAGGVATYSLAGSHTGYRLLWVLTPITIALIMVQEMSARMGIVSGKGLADLIREKFGLKVTFYTLIFLIFADLGNTMAEFAGIAAAGEIFGISRYITVPVCSVLVWLLVLKGDYKIVERIFLFGCLVYLSYIISGLLIKPDWSLVAESLFIPDVKNIQKSDFPIIVGLLGTSITPWMQFYIQSAVVEKGISPKNLIHSKIDVVVGCLSMLTVTVFIIICCAATLNVNGIKIQSAAEAAVALKPFAGEYSSLLFALGLFNASFFAAALLPLATSYYVCEGLGWESGVDKNFNEAPNFFTIFTALIIFSAILVLIPSIDLFQVLIWSQVVNGILIPIILVYILKLCNDPEIMGEYTNSNFFNAICYLIIGLMIGVNGAMIYLEVF
ncbi:MAG: Nramp family divalent metal transporter [Bacteriovoracaceae bacterium]